MPTRALVRHPAAKRDLAEATAYLVEEAGSEVAHEFLDDVAHVFTRLRRFPNLGRPWPTTNPALVGLRRLPLQRFPLSVIYRPTRTAIEIVRVLHHARDIPPLLEDL